MPELITFGDIDLVTMDIWTTKVFINNVPYELTITVDQRYPGSAPNMYGYWQDFVVANLDVFVTNISRDNLDEARISLSFVYHGVGYVMNYCFKKESIKKVKNVKQ